MLRSSPGFTAVAILSLAPGIGANTAIFMLMNGPMLKSPPVHNPKELVSFGSDFQSGESVRSGSTRATGALHS